MTDTRSTPLIYLASPYSPVPPETPWADAIRDRRFRAVCRAAARLLRDGHHIFSPIAHSHALALAGALPTDWHFWKAYDEALLAVCAELWVLMLPDWESSTGVAAEIAWATERGMPVRYVCPTEAEYFTAAGVEPAAEPANG
jgi:hypothetical protein